jgi:hypothetical protein
VDDAPVLKVDGRERPARFVLDEEDTVQTLDVEELDQLRGRQLRQVSREDRPGRGIRLRRGRERGAIRQRRGTGRSEGRHVLLRTGKMPPVFEGGERTK